MPTFNVLVGVVELIDAADETEAIQKLHARLRAAKFEPYSDSIAVHIPHAFLSDTKV